MTKVKSWCLQYTNCSNYEIKVIVDKNDLKAVTQFNKIGVNIIETTAKFRNSTVETFIKFEQNDNFKNKQVVCLLTDNDQLIPHFVQIA